MLQRQKLEYMDFSAGISENTVPGKPNAYARADNLIITRDKHLETRAGSAALSDTLYVLPSMYTRVGALFNFYNDTALLAQTSKDFFYQLAGTWTTLLGPTSNHAFNSNSSTSRVASAQWRQHLYMVTDSGDGPQVFYFDNSGTAQLRTAGLPRPVFSPLYTNSQWLSAGITLATTLVTAMISHISDHGTGSFAHLAQQTAVTTALAALSTPTTLSQLITYVQAVVTQYNLHITDAQLDVAGPQVYHINKQKVANLSTPFYGRYSVLNQLASTSLASPTDLPTTIAVLNDVRNRYNMHTYATLTHQNAVTLLSTGGTFPSDITGYGKYACATAPVVQNIVITINTDPTDNIAPTTIYSPGVSGNLGVFCAYINQVKAEFNAHLANATYHNAPDTDNQIVISNCTDILSATIVMAHLEFFFWWHYQDSLLNENGAFQFWTVDIANTGVTNGSPTISGSYGSINYAGLYVQNMIYGPSAWAVWNLGQLCVAQRVSILSNTSSTITLSSNISTAASATATFLVANPTANMRFSTSIYHYGLDNFTGTPITTPISYNARVLAFDYSLSEPNSLILEASAFLGYFKTHELSQWQANNTDPTQPRYYISNTQSAVLYAVHQAPVNVGGIWPQAAVPNPAGGNYNSVQAANYFTLASVSTMGSALYTFVWRYNYTAGGLFFENDSTPALLSTFQWQANPSGPLPSQASPYPVTLSGFPVLTNASNQNWDTANIVLDIYRTITNGQSFFLVGTVTNGTTTFTDTVTDTQLVSNEPLYTTGGVLQNDQPPASKFITLINSTAYYGYCTDITSGQIFPNRILQSIPSAPYAVPAENFDDLDDTLTGLSNFNNYVVAFCRTKIYRMEGSYDELGNGLLTHVQIAPTVGAISHASIVQTDYGIFFCGTNGIYWTDGFTLTRVTGELEATYNGLISTSTQQARINGVYDKLTRRVYWTFCSSSGVSECDVAYILDLNWGISEKMSFTTFSGANFSPSALVIFNSQLIRGTSYGFLFQHGSQYTSDQTPLLAQTSTPSTQWAPQAIIYDFKSCQTHFGSSQFKKWVTRVTFQGQAQTPLYMQINRSNNNNPTYLPLVPVRSILTSGMIDTYRRMPAGSLRCDWMAIEFTNASLILYGSDSLGVVSVSALSAGSITLTLTGTWPVWMTLYTIAFQNDGYVKPYTITGQTTHTLTVADPDATSPAGQTGVLWQISGIAYGQQFNLTAYNVSYAVLSDEQSAYQGATSTDGGANTT